MAAHLAWLHLKRWGRILAELGPFRVLFLLALAALGFRWLYEWYDDGYDFVLLGIIPLLHFLQASRKDHRFLHFTLGIKSTQVYAVLYTALALPFALLLLVEKEWVYGLSALGFAWLLAQFTPKAYSTDRLFLNIGGFLPKRYFEWRTGLRQYGLAVVVLWLLGMGFGFHPAGPCLAIFFLTLNTSVFYLYSESKELLALYGNKPKTLLRNKIFGHLKLFSVLILPLVIIFFIFSMEYWYIMLYTLLAALVVNISTLLFKYAIYEPGMRLDNNQSLQALSMASFLIPFMPPVSVVLAIVNWRKAIKNLKVYL